MRVKGLAALRGVGKLADLTVLSVDPPSAPPAELLAARVLSPNFGGRIGHAAGDGE